MHAAVRTSTPPARHTCFAECFERASLPQTTPEERKRLLSFVIVGGGPTGVEVAAEIHDLITEDLVKLYPEEVGVDTAAPTRCPAFRRSATCSFLHLLCTPAASAAPQVKVVRIRLIELMDHVLSTYDRAISTYTAGEGMQRGSRACGQLSSAAACLPLL